MNGTPNSATETRSTDISRLPDIKISSKRVVSIGTAALVLLVAVFITLQNLWNSSNSPDVRFLDSDGDGLPDEAELNGWRALHGEVYYTDPYNADSDGDGLSDGREAGTSIPLYIDHYLYSGISDPTSVDTDQDELTDYEEVSGWRISENKLIFTSPRLADTDGDGLSDREEAGEYSIDNDSTKIFAYRSDPTNPDTDGDGLNDGTEVLGWQDLNGELFYSDPLLGDTDGDGLPDADEADSLLDASASLPIYAGYSDPRLVDTDGDGLTDIEEADLSTDPMRVDSDNDGLSDYVEVNIVGTAPDTADTDGDGYLDGFEYDNRESQGLDPLVFDVQISKTDYITDFAKGALAGEFMPEPSVAWLAGNLVSSGSGMIPGPGWAFGSLADARDTVALLLKHDWVSAGFTVVGLIPGVGDSAAIPQKVAKFVAKHPELTDAVTAIIAVLNKVPDHIKANSIKATNSNAWKRLSTVRFSDKRVIALGKARTDFTVLETAYTHRLHVPQFGLRSPMHATGRDGEKYLERTLKRQSKDVSTQFHAPTKECEVGCNLFARRVDMLADGVAHESKVGRVSLSDSVAKQIRSDAFLIQTGAIKGAHWNFFTSAVSNSCGPSRKVLELLEQNDIPFTMYCH